MAPATKAVFPIIALFILPALAWAGNAKFSGADSRSVFETAIAISDAPGSKEILLWKNSRPIRHHTFFVFNKEQIMTFSHPNRRAFLRTAATGLAGAAAIVPVAKAATPPERPGDSYFKLSLAGYSFNRLLPRRGTPEEQAAAKMSLEDFVRFCARLDLDACEPTSYYFPKEVSHDYLMKLKELTFRLGLDISGTAIGNDFCLPEGADREAELAMTREWIDHAAALGAPVIRIFAGKVPDGETVDTAIERCAAGINTSLDYAAEKGVLLALENHGGITAEPEQMLRIIEAVKPSPWFGVNFDSGNFRTADPYAALEQIAPYAVNAQIKVAMHPNGNKEPADFARILDILRDAGYRGYIVLEYEEDEDPFEAIPRHMDELKRLIRG